MVFAANTLSQIHEIYYINKASIEAKASKLQLSNCMAQYRNSLLRKVSAILIDSENESRVKYRCKYLGLELQDESTSTPSLVIRRELLKNPTTIKKIKYYSSTLKVPVVTEEWIHNCYEYSYVFPSKNYVLEEPLEENVEGSRFANIVRLAG